MEWLGSAVSVYSTKSASGVCLSLKWQLSLSQSPVINIQSSQQTLRDSPFTIQ